MRLARRAFLGLLAAGLAPRNAGAQGAGIPHRIGWLSSEARRPLVNRVKIAQFAVAQRLPSMFGWSEYADAGGLMSYGANTREAYVRLAAYADRLLRGSRPGDLPIEQPTRFELVINLKTTPPRAGVPARRTGR